MANPKKDNQPIFIAPHASAASDEVLLELPSVNMQTREHLVDLYLQLIHDKPHTLFHPPTLRAQVCEDAVPRVILFSIMSLAARFSDDPSARPRTKEFFNYAKDSFRMDLFNMSLENIQAAVLVGNLCGVEGQPELESLFFGIAFRLAQIIRLPTPNLEDGAVSKEVKLRTWWTLYMIDRWSSAGLAVPQQLSDNDHFHHLPMPELKFWHLKPDHPQSEEHYHNESHGLWGYMVMLARIFGHIQNLHKSLADGALNDMEAEQRTRNLAHELERYIDLLPLEIHFSVENLKNHAALGLGRAFVALHLGYHHYATLLYFPYLDHQQRETPNRAMYSSRCKHHAVQFSDILRLSHEVEDCEALYFIVGHMTVVSSAALIHTLLFGQQEELPQTRSRLCDNFAILLKLREYWPAVELMIERLFTFQKVCMWSMEKIYTVDKWVVKFLLRHALPIEEFSTMPPLSERGKFANDTLSILRRPTCSQDNLW
ncbi:hypothetical protein ZTR_00617 [Talaromyces verruculosus]|nr:hypothetical protein ZTR_00617 [Talaromyces verruculosus]